MCADSADDDGAAGAFDWMDRQIECVYFSCPENTSGTVGYSDLGQSIQIWNNIMMVVMVLEPVVSFAIQ